jgi:hypothetical protein
VIALTCPSTISASCDQQGVELMVVGFDHTNPRPACRACRASAEVLGLPLRPFVAVRDTDRRRFRVVLPGEDFGRRVADALRARRMPLAH